MCRLFLFVIFCFKQKTAYELRISDWSSDVCSSDLRRFRSFLDRRGCCGHSGLSRCEGRPQHVLHDREDCGQILRLDLGNDRLSIVYQGTKAIDVDRVEVVANNVGNPAFSLRSEEHTSELQSLMRISYAVFCLIKKKQT